ncbi:MAG: ArgR family transcriptional regulator [Coriobacteriales bacterium]|nr:ArgR family transcriptional regulator [Coriobacteriales bacterium]
MRARDSRQEAICQLVRTERIKTQKDLVRRLHEMGVECTQATVSRDVAELELGKLPDGSYILAVDHRVHRMVGDLVTKVARAGNIVVIHAMSGAAQGVAAALDEAGSSEILGCVAGDDTIMAVAADDQSAQAFEKRLLDLMNADNNTMIFRDNNNE